MQRGCASSSAMRSCSIPNPKRHPRKHRSMADEEFDFEALGRQFGFDSFPALPSGIGSVFMKAIVTSSKATRTLYEEHLVNGFDEKTALLLVMHTQREVLKAVAYVSVEGAKLAMQMAEEE